MAVVASASAQAAGFEVVGHRGARGLRAENTIPAFQEAVRVGATAVELDVVIARNGFVVVSHERRISPLQCRGTGVGRLVKNLTFEQLLRLDCGTRGADDGLAQTQVPVPGAHVPLLDQILRLVGQGRTRVIVELKVDPTRRRETLAAKPFARRVVTTLRKARMLRRTTVQSYDWGALREVARLEPRLRLMALASSKTVYPGSPWLGGVRVRRDPFPYGLAGAVQRAGFDAVSPDAAKVSPELIFSAHFRGLEVLPYTVNAPAEMRRLVEMGVDGLVSDYPDRLRRAVQEAKAPIAG